jgi:hypothetical protein
MTEPRVVLRAAEEEGLPQLEFGDSGSVLRFGGEKGAPLLRMFGDNDLTVVVEDGQVKVSTLIRDRSGSAVAEIVNNEWKVNPAKSFDRNYSKNELEVKDDAGEIVLQIRVLHDRVQFQGKFYDRHGNGVALGKMRHGDEVGGVIEMTGPAHPELLLQIEPIFRYPSDQHLGEHG